MTQVSLKRGAVTPWLSLALRTNTLKHGCRSRPGQPDFTRTDTSLTCRNLILAGTTGLCLAQACCGMHSPNCGWLEQTSVKRRTNWEARGEADVGRLAVRAHQLLPHEEDGCHICEVYIAVRAHAPRRHRAYEAGMLFYASHS